MALNGLICAEVLLRNYSLTQSRLWAISCSRRAARHVINRTYIALSSCNKTSTDYTNVMQMRMRRFQLLHDMACIVVKWATEDGDTEEVCQKQLMMSAHVWPSAMEVQWWLDVRQRSWIRARGSGRNSVLYQLNNITVTDMGFAVLMTLYVCCCS